MVNKLIQELDGGGWNQGAALEVDIQKVEPTGFPDRFNVGCERKRRVKAFSPSNWKDGVPFTERGDSFVGCTGLGGNRSLVWDLSLKYLLDV